MMPDGCQYESELVDALASGQWPDASGEELRDHVSGCNDCQELALVAGAILTDRHSDEVEVNVPPSGAVWWRMQLRVKREAFESATRTVRRAHTTMVGLTIGAIVTVLAMTPLLGFAWRWFTSALPTSHELAAIWSAVPLTPFVLVAGVLLLFAPVVLYLAVAEE